jgi:hypothetical protein
MNIIKSLERIEAIRMTREEFAQWLLERGESKSFIEVLLEIWDSHEPILGDDEKSDFMRRLAEGPTDVYR